MKSHKSHKTINYVSKKNTYKKYTKSFIGGSGTTPTEPFFVLSESKQQQFFTDTFAKIGTKTNVSVDEFNKSSIIIDKEDFPKNIILYAFVILYYIVEHKFKIDINTKDKQKQTEFIKILKIFVDKIINDINTYNNNNKLLLLLLESQKCITRTQYVSEFKIIYKILAQYFSKNNSKTDINDFLFITCITYNPDESKQNAELRQIQFIEINPFAHINPKNASGKRVIFNNTKNRIRIINNRNQNTKQ